MPQECTEMKELRYQKLSIEGFAKFGSYANMINPSGPHLGSEPIEFYRDMLQSGLGQDTLASFGICRVTKRPFVMDVSEFHDLSCEAVLPLDGDILMHVAPAGPEKEFPFDLAEVFLVPQGTLAVLRPGVWHHAPYAFQCDCVNCLIVLPERTYVRDCKVYEFPADRHLKIVGDGLK
jgi:ureidoglycolate lyase